MIEGLLKKSIIEDVLGSIEAWNILVLDDIATYMLSQLLKMDDVIAGRRVISVEHIHALKHLFDEEIAAPVRFFVRPTVENLVRILTSLSKPNTLCKSPISVSLTRVMNHFDIKLTTVLLLI